MPKWLADLARRDRRLTLLRGEDHGPASKLLPTLRYLVERNQTSTTRLLILDDDVEYTPSLLCDYARESNLYPGLVALGYRGTNVTKQEMRSRNGCVRLPVGKGATGHAVPVDYITITGSMFVPAAAFDESIWDYSGCPSATRTALFVNDDLWINGHLARRGVKRLRVTTLPAHRTHCRPCSERPPFPY